MLGTSYSDYVIAKTEQNKRMPSDYTWNNVEHCGQGAKSQGSVIQKGLSSEGGGSVEVYNTKPIHLWTTQKTHLSIPTSNSRIHESFSKSDVLGII